MNITVGGWFGFLIGIAMGGISGIIIGFIIADEHWHRKLAKMYKKNESQAPYEITKGD